MIIETAIQQTEANFPAAKVLHLIDVENLVGAAHFAVPQAKVVHAAYERVAPCGSVNQTVIATSHHAALPAWLTWPATTRRLVRSGPDGADLALLGVLAHEAVAGRFQHVVIGSGDGIFALPAARLQSAGCTVTVVTRRGALSRELRLAVRDVRYIDPEPAVIVMPAMLRAA